MMNAHLRQPDVTKAALCRDLSAMMADDRKVSTQVLATFIGNKGPMRGVESDAFYAGYVFFEKLRVKNGKKKRSKFREEMEEKWPVGLRRRDLSKANPTIMKIIPMKEDKYGVAHEKYPRNQLGLD